MSSGVAGVGDVRGSVSSTGDGDRHSTMAVAEIPHAGAPAASDAGAVAAGEMLTARLLRPTRSRRRRHALRARLLSSWQAMPAALLGSLAVGIATTLAVLISPDGAAAVVPAACIAAAAWCAALQYMHSGGAGVSSLTLGAPVAATVAGAIALAGASAAVILLPGMQALDRTEVFVIAVGVAAGTLIYDLVRRHFGPRRRVLVVGADSGGAELIDELQGRPELPFECVGLIDDGAHPLTVLGNIDDLPWVIERERPDLIVLAGVNDRARAIQRIFEVSRFRFRLLDLSHFYEDAFGRLPLHNLTPGWFMGLLHIGRRPYSRAAKRAFDLMIAGVAVIPVLLLFPLVALLVRCSGRGPILFEQTRLGEGGKLFQIYKFRTMVPDAERPGVAVWASAADPRITPIGRFMRRTRLDELPQLWNVLRGDMSIVGPRPERPEFLEFLEKEVPFWERRHLVKPGVTGWAQVRCGYTDDSLGAADKLSHDLYYLKHRCLLLDLAIAAKTAAIVVRGTGAR